MPKRGTKFRWEIGNWERATNSKRWVGRSASRGLCFSLSPLNYFAPDFKVPANEIIVIIVKILVSGDKVDWEAGFRITSLP